MKMNMNRHSKHQTTEFTSTVVAYLHYIHSHASPLVCIHGFKNPWGKKCVSRHRKVKFFSPSSLTFMHLWVSTYWTCSPDGQCRSGSHQSQCHSCHQQTSGWSAATGCCSAACLHVKKHSNIHISSVVFVKRCNSNIVSLVSKSMKITVMMAWCLKSGLMFYKQRNSNQVLVVRAAPDSDLQLWEQYGAHRRTFSLIDQCQRTRRASETEFTSIFRWCHPPYTASQRSLQYSK